MNQLRLALVIHNHQPIGNFDGVFDQAYLDSYQPFLEVLSESPEIAITLHNSGSLLEWLVAHRPEYLDQVRSMVERGQIEIIGGPFYEPILSGIPQRDRVGQIKSYSRFLNDHFGLNVRGMWVPERVWEQSFARDLVDAGIEYTVLDDYHFRCAGLRDEELTSYFLTEDEGRLLKIFPVAEQLRYTIPFQEPEKSLDFLHQVYLRNPNGVVTFGDDGEKFGTWPKTKQSVYEEGWLRSFFQMLQNARDWLQVSTLSECIDNVAPAGRIYLPDSSYREMTEWVLPPERQATVLSLRKKKEETDEDWPALSPFVRGGFWRNFRTKYPEANEMYARMLQVSDRLDRLNGADVDREFADQLNEAATELYRGQCNCSYWHGAFGGLYLPHLRHAVYEHLIRADSILERVERGVGCSLGGDTAAVDRYVRLDTGDFNLDSHQDVRLSSERLIAFVVPANGGHLYELDVRAIARNLMATMTRRPEIYHEAILKAARGDEDDSLNAASVQDGIECKQDGLDQKIAYDEWPRRSLIDHFLQPQLTLDEFRQGRGLLGDFRTGAYATELRSSAERVEVCLARRSELASHDVQVTKAVAIERAHGGAVHIRYLLENLPPGLPLHFGVEFNFSGLPGGAPDRYFYDKDGQRLGQLESVLELPEFARIGLVDEWLGVDLAIEATEPGGLWTFPIETVSQSEGGFETVHQNCCVVPHWEFVVPETRTWSVELKLEVDVSAAQARELERAAEAAASR